jgi:hypothetical protein
VALLVVAAVAVLATWAVTRPLPQPAPQPVRFTVAPAGTLPLAIGSSNRAIALSPAQVAVLDLKTGHYKILVRGGSSAEYVETGHLLYAAAGTLRAVRFSPVRLKVLSDPVPVVEQIMAKATGAAEFSVSRHGALVYVPGSVTDLLAGGLHALVCVQR